MKKKPTTPLSPPAPIAPARDVRFDTRNAEIEGLLSGLYALLAKDIPAGWGFAVQIFQVAGAEAGAAPTTFYISSVDQATTKRMLMELVMKL